MTDSALTSLVFFFKNIRLDLIQQLHSAKEGARKLVLLFFFFFFLELLSTTGKELQIQMTSILFEPQMTSDVLEHRLEHQSGQGIPCYWYHVTQYNLPHGDADTALRSNELSR